jgi:manganese/zinc/iron transport system permease protein
MSSDFFVVFLTLLAIGLGASQIGVHLVVRRESMLADALSHALLPGLVAAFLLSNGTSPAAMLLGALSAGLLSTWTLEILKRWTLAREDAAIGIAFTGFFSVGVWMISVWGTNTHLDASCLLFGEILFVPLEDSGFIGLPVSTEFALAAALGLTACNVCFGKRFLWLGFDPLSLKVSGVSAHLATLVFRSLAAVALVAGFRAVGAILMLALISLPALVARVWCRQLHSLTLGALGTVSVVSVLSLWIGYAWNLNIPSLSASLLFFFLIVSAGLHRLIVLR